MEPTSFTFPRGPRRPMAQGVNGGLLILDRVGVGARSRTARLCEPVPRHLNDLGLDEDDRSSSAREVRCGAGSRRVALEIVQQADQPSRTIETDFMR